MVDRFGGAGAFPRAVVDALTQGRDGRPAGDAEGRVGGAGADDHDRSLARGPRDRGRAAEAVRRGYDVVVEPAPHHG